MSYPRTTFDLFSIELPPGLVFAGLAEAEPLPPPITFASRFAAIVAVNGPASIALSKMEAAGGQSLTHIVRRCAAERGSSNPSLFFESFGGETYSHPGLLAEIETGCEHAVFEDGGLVIVMEASGDASIWSEYEPFLRRAMLSVELRAPLGPTLPLSPGAKVPELEPGRPDPDAVAAAVRQTAWEKKSKEAEGLINAGRFDQAESLLIDRQSGPEVFARMSQLYEQRLRDASVDRTTREALWRRALDWTVRSYPEPHTQIEADDYSRGMAEDRARLVDLLGYDPG